jgi:class 3 adenylate cyclase
LWTSLNEYINNDHDETADDTAGAGNTNTSHPHQAVSNRNRKRNSHSLGDGMDGREPKDLTPPLNATATNQRHDAALRGRGVRRGNSHMSHLGNKAMSSNSAYCCSCWRTMSDELKYNLKTMKDNPKIIGVCVTVFLVLITCSVVTVQVLYYRYVTQMDQQLTRVANETLGEVVRLWHQAFLPLMSIQQAIQLSPQLQNLSIQLSERILNPVSVPVNVSSSEEGQGIVNEDEPYYPGGRRRRRTVQRRKATATTTSSGLVYRNVTAICDNIPELQSLLTNIIVKGINAQFDSQNILREVRLAPRNILCMAEPALLQQGEADNERTQYNNTNKHTSGLDLEHSQFILLDEYEYDGSVVESSKSITMSADPKYIMALQSWQSAIIYQQQQQEEEALLMQIPGDGTDISTEEELQSPLFLSTMNTARPSSSMINQQIHTFGPASLYAAPSTNNMIMDKSQETEHGNDRNNTNTEDEDEDAFQKMDDKMVIVQEALLGHLTVYVPVPKPSTDNKRALHSDDEDLVEWGTLEVVVDWGLLKEQQLSRTLYDRIEAQGMQFVTTKTALSSSLASKSTPEVTTVVIASSSSGSDLIKTDGSGSTVQTITRMTSPAGNVNDGSSVIDVDAADADNTEATIAWTQSVGYTDGHYDPTFYRLGMAFAVLGSCLASLLLVVTLVERRNHKTMLYKLMPKNAINKLSRNQTVVEHFDQVTIFFSDIIGFTSMAGEMSPIQVMKMLNELYSEFDKICAKHKIYKVETIGDAYMVVGGACAPNQKKISKELAAERVALFALEVTMFVKTFETSDGVSVHIRAGLASGPVVGGVVGSTMPRYCFFGDTVNFASRMESTSTKLKVQCCPLTHRMLQNAPTHVFHLKERVDEDNPLRKGIQVKGKGVIHTSWIRKAQPRSRQLDDNALSVYTMDIDTTTRDAFMEDSSSHRRTSDVAAADLELMEAGLADLGLATGSTSNANNHKHKQQQHQEIVTMTDIQPSAHFGAKSCLHRMSELPADENVTSLACSLRSYGLVEEQDIRDLLYPDLMQSRSTTASTHINRRSAGVKKGGRVDLQQDIQKLLYPGCSGAAGERTESGES